MIRNYHDTRSSSDTTRPDAKFTRVGKNNKVKQYTPAEAGNIMYLGTETETVRYRDWGRAEEASDMVDELRGDYCHCEHDGSLNCGFEIVTEPMTLAAHRAANWGELFSRLEHEYDAKSHDTQTCGLHVHVSRAGLGNEDRDRELCIAKILALVEKFEQELACFARRDFRSCQWCRPTGFGYVQGDSTRNLLRKEHEIQDRQGYCCHDSDRYRAVNLQNKNTIEFRIFKGTLNPNTYYATLALVDGLCRWCKQHCSNELTGLSWTGLLEWINDDTLTTYWHGRQGQMWRFA